MSDPLTNSEIQDVLSSIRRLVSEDNRHRTERERGRAGPAAEAGKLVLTEALRVAEQEPEAEDAAPAGGAVAQDVPAEVTDTAEEDSVRENVTGEGQFEAEGRNPAIAEAEAGDDWEEAADASAGTLEDTIAELEAAVAGIGGEFEPDGSEVARGREIDAELEEAFEEGFAVDEAAEDEMADLAQPVTGGAVGGSDADDPDIADTDGGDEAGAKPAEVAAEATATPESDGRATEAEGGRETAEAIPEASEASGAVGADHLVFRTNNGDEPVEELTDVVDAGETAADGEDDVVPAFIASSRTRTPRDGAASDDAPPADRPRRLTLTAADAVPDVAAPWDREDAMPVGDGEVPEAADDAPGLASALAGEIADESEGAAAEGDESSLFDAGGDTVIDMDMLRDLVAEIIREELQGTLGERITRNVRMLVRREISRALETHKFE